MSATQTFMRGGGQGDSASLATLSRNEINGQIQGQGLITHNFAVNAGLAKWRRDRMADPSVPKSRLMHPRLDSTRQPNDFVNVRSGDLFVIYSDVTAGSGAGGDGATKASGFTTFNGHLVPEGADQEAFEDSLRVVGQVAQGYDFPSQNVLQPEAGVAVYVGGSVSYVNHGFDTHFPGDLIAWRAPSVDESRRNEEIAAFRQYQSKLADPERLTPYLERVNYARTSAFFEQELWQSLDDERSELYDFWSGALGAGNLSMSARKKAAAFKRADALANGLAFVAAGLAYGLIDVIAPNPANGLDASAFKQSRSVVDDTLGKALSYRYNVVRNDQGAVQRVERAPVNDQQAYLKEVSEKLKFIAAHAGLLSPKARGQCEPSVLFQNAAVGIATSGLLPDPKAQRAFSIRRFFPASAHDQEFLPRSSRNAIDSRRNLSDPLGSLSFVFASTGRLYHEYVGHATARANNKVVFKALSLAAPGDRGDQLSS